MSALPTITAVCSAVFPSASGMLQSAPALSKSATVSVCPNATALCSAVTLSLLRTLTAALHCCIGVPIEASQVKRCVGSLVAGIHRGTRRHEPTRNLRLALDSRVVQGTHSILITSCRIRAMLDQHRDDLVLPPICGAVQRRATFAVTPVYAGALLQEDLGHRAAALFSSRMQRGASRGLDLHAAFGRRGWYVQKVDTRAFAKQLFDSFRISIAGCAHQRGLQCQSWEQYRAFRFRFSSILPVALTAEIGVAIFPQQIGRESCLCFVRLARLQEITFLQEQVTEKGTASPMSSMPSSILPVSSSPPLAPSATPHCESGRGRRLKREATLAFAAPACVRGVPNTCNGVPLAPPSVQPLYVQAEPPLEKTCTTATGHTQRMYGRVGSRWQTCAQRCTAGVAGCGPVGCKEQHLQGLRRGSTPHVKRVGGRTQPRKETAAS